MKKNETTAAAKKARKAFKKQLTEKIISQLKSVVQETGIDSKKNVKAIEKAAKNLAKKMSKQTGDKKVPAEPVKTETAKSILTDTPVKAKATPTKKAAAETK